MKLTVWMLTLVVALAAPSRALWADGLDHDATWSELTNDGRSFVFGRVEGRFDGAEYRGRKIRVKNEETGKEYKIGIGRGRGYFEAVLPVGTYTLLSIEAVYFPPVKSMSLSRFRPVPQRYMLQPIPERWVCAHSRDSASVTVASVSLYRFMNPPRAVTPISVRASASLKWSRRAW